MSEHATILSSRVRLARNYEDLPFEVAEKPDDAAMCISRTANAMKLSGADRDFEMLRLSDMSANQRLVLSESHLISNDLMRHPDTAAVLLNVEESTSVMMNEEDHLRIQSIVSGDALQAAADRCFRVEDALSRQVTFAFDHQLGYLTACPTNTGTGMRASLLMHLPMLTIGKQMGNVGQIVAKVGLTIRGVYGEGAEALGSLYQVSNQVTLGRTEQEIISAVTTVGHQLTDMELSLREKSATAHRLELEDPIWRAWGLMCNARMMDLPEFFKHWSAVRLGASMGLLDVKTDTLDQMLEQVQDGHLRDFAEASLNRKELSVTRSSRIRGMLVH